MGFNLTDILRASLLIVNSMAILSERRFLAKWGMASHDVMRSLQTINTNDIDGQFEPGLRTQVANILSSVRLILRIPLIIINVLAIILGIILG